MFTTYMHFFHMYRRIVVQLQPVTSEIVKVNTHLKYVADFIFKPNPPLFYTFSILEERIFIFSPHPPKALKYKAFLLFPRAFDFHIFGQFYRIFHHFCRIFLTAPVQMSVNLILIKNIFLSFLLPLFIKLNLNKLLYGH